MKTETKVGIGVALALLGYYLYNKNKTSSTKSSDTDKKKTDSTTKVVNHFFKEQVTPKIPPIIDPNTGYDRLSEIQKKKLKDTLDKLFPPDVPKAPVDEISIIIPPTSPKPIDCELFPDNPACADIIKVPPIPITPPDDIYIPKRKIPEPIETPIDSPIYGGGGALYPKLGYPPNGGGHLYAYDPLPYRPLPTPPKFNPPIPNPPYLYVNDPLPYTPPVSYEPIPPVSYDPPVNYEPTHPKDKLLPELIPIDDYSNNNPTPNTPISYGGGGGGSVAGYGGGNSGGGGFFGGGGRLFDFGFDIPLTSGRRKGSVIVPETDFDEYGNALN